MKSDKDLQRDVQTELSREPSINAAQVGVAAKEGVVSLTGHVPTHAGKQVAEKATRREYGVRDVANERDVRLPGSSRRTDEDIAAACLGL